MAIDGRLALGDRLPEADAVDDRGVIQLVADDDVFFAQEGSGQRLVGVPTAHETERGGCTHDRAHAASSSRCTLNVPQMNRTDAVPAPNRSSTHHLGQRPHYSAQMLGEKNDNIHISSTHHYSLRGQRLRALARSR